jgi:hypothetical protein
MARIRTIKPEFFTSEDIVSLTPFARLLYIALWCEADRDGRLVWRPRTFKMRYLPADQIDIEALCKELIKIGMIQLYGDGLAFIPSFLDHQHINPRESQSKLPKPDASSTREQRKFTSENQDEHAQVGRKEGKEYIHASNFDTFWISYPKKTAKPAAEKAWAKAKASDDFEVLMQALAKQKESDQWKSDGGKFIPNPATWINQRRWEDETGEAANDIMDGVL